MNKINKENYRDLEERLYKYTEGWTLSNGTFPLNNKSEALSAEVILEKHYANVDRYNLDYDNVQVDGTAYQIEFSDPILQEKKKEDEPLKFYPNKDPNNALINHMYAKSSDGGSVEGAAPSGGGGMGESLEEDIVKNDKLNPALWTDDNELKDGVKEKILNIVDNFKDSLAEEDIDLKVKDVVLIGSNCSYNYSKDSDLDVHIVCDLSDYEGKEEELSYKLYDAYKRIWNSKYEPLIKGVPVELYVENGEIHANSKGMYSLSSGWIKEPANTEVPEIDKEEFSKEFEPWEERYNKVIEDPKLEEVNKLIDDLYIERQKGMLNGGEFSMSNLVFKEFRNLGYLQTLKDLKVDLENEEMSLESLSEDVNMEKVNREFIERKIEEFFKHCTKVEVDKVQDGDDTLYEISYKPEIIDKFEEFDSSLGLRISEFTDYGSKFNDETNEYEDEDVIQVSLEADYSSDIEFDVYFNYSSLDNKEELNKLFERLDNLFSDEAIDYMVKEYADDMEESLDIIEAMSELKDIGEKFEGWYYLAAKNQDGYLRFIRLGHSGRPIAAGRQMWTPNLICLFNDLDAAEDFAERFNRSSTVRTNYDWKPVKYNGGGEYFYANLGKVNTQCGECYIYKGEDSDYLKFTNYDNHKDEPLVGKDDAELNAKHQKLNNKRSAIDDIRNMEESYEDWSEEEFEKGGEIIDDNTTLMISDEEMHDKLLALLGSEERVNKFIDDYDEFLADDDFGVFEEAKVFGTLDTKGQKETRKDKESQQAYKEKPSKFDIKADVDESYSNGGYEVVQDGDEFLVTSYDADDELVVHGSYATEEEAKDVLDRLVSKNDEDEYHEYMLNKDLPPEMYDHKRFKEELDEDLGEDKANALINYLGDDVSVESDDDKLFITDDGDYYVLTEDEAYELAVDNIKQLVEELGLDSFSTNFAKEIVRDPRCFDMNKINSIIKEEINYLNDEDQKDLVEYLENADDEEKLQYVLSLFDENVKDLLNLDVIADRCIEADGVANSIAYYDGEEIDLGNGLYAYRVN